MMKRANKFLKVFLKLLNNYQAITIYFRTRYFLIRKMTQKRRGSLIKKHKEGADCKERKSREKIKELEDEIFQVY